MANQTIERPTTRARVKYVGRSAYKVRQVANLIRGKEAEEAQNILMLTNRGASEEISQLLNSAIANAEHNQQIPVEELRVKEIFVDEGPTAKRFRARARGRGSRIFKRSSHITIVLERMTQEDIETKAQKDSASGAANAREQRRRRAQASKEAAAAKAASAESSSQEDSSSSAASRPSGHDEPEVSSLAADASEEEAPKKKTTKKPAAKKTTSKSQEAKDERPRESTGSASDSTDKTEEGDA